MLPHGDDLFGGLRRAALVRHGERADDIDGPAENDVQVGIGRQRGRATLQLSLIHI